MNDAAETAERHHILFWPVRSIDEQHDDCLFWTDGGGIGFSVNGHVIVKPFREWHKLANSAALVRQFNEWTPPNTIELIESQRKEIEQLRHDLNPVMDQSKLSGLADGQRRPPAKVCVPNSGFDSRDEGQPPGWLVIDRIEILALKKLAVICGALGQTLPDMAAREQRALTSVLVDVINRAEIDNARNARKTQEEQAK